MADTRTETRPATGRISITRRIDASPEDVFDAWTTADSMKQWMLPGPTKEARVTLDARVGGRFRIDMIGDGATHEHTGEFLVVDRPRVLKFTWISRSTGQQVSTVTVSLEPKGRQTVLTLTHEGLPNEESARNHEKGWTDIVEKLASAVS